MVKRYIGGVISATSPTVSNSSASGLWNTSAVAQYKQAGNWASVPGAPTSVSATPGNGQAIVSFTAPANTGGFAITSYTVTSSPGNFTATGSSSPLTVSGLTNDTSYTFTVTATNSIGTGPASTVSGSVTPGIIVNYLVVAGGGSGGSAQSAGGGAGGLLTASGVNVISGVTYTITIGAGGTSVTTDVQGNNGSNSSISGSGFTTVGSASSFNCKL